MLKTLIKLTTLNYFDEISLAGLCNSYPVSLKVLIHLPYLEKSEFNAISHIYRESLSVLFFYNFEAKFPLEPLEYRKVIQGILGAKLLYKLALLECY